MKKKHLQTSAILLFVLLLLGKSLRTSTTFLGLLQHDISQGPDWTTAATQTTQTATPPRHRPRRFSTNASLNVARGLNILNMLSGSVMAAWIYDGKNPPRGSPWNDRKSPHKFLSSANNNLNTSQNTLKHNDTLFVGFDKLEEFVHSILPNITTDVVLITCNWVDEFNSTEWVAPLAHAIVSHPHVLGWFVKNVARRLGDVYANHKRIHSFPLGLKPYLGPAAYRRPVPFYRKAFLDFWNVIDNKNSSFQKTQILYLSPIRDTNKIRKALLQQPEYAQSKNTKRILQYQQYLRKIAGSVFVLSPDGVRPDCHRHYESIGLGAIPITNNPRQYYPHLEEADLYGVLYNNSMSNLTLLQEQLTPLAQSYNPSSLNRNMVFEEYYMEWIESVVGRPLRWWDVVVKQPAFLEEFATALPEGVSVEIL